MSASIDTARPGPQHRTLVMGVINVTPDSFSDGGEYLATGDAVRRGLELLDQGADLLDVGGESTRPGAERPSVAEERRRVVPVIEALARQGARVSVDTMRAAVAETAVEAGAVMVNDVSGGLADEAMLDTVARLGVDYVCMHWRGHLTDALVGADYSDVVAEVVSELAGRRAACLAAGIPASRLILDPGFGFSKNADHNWELLQGLGSIQELGQRVLVGVSRKRFLGELLDGREPGERDAATTAITALMAQQGVWGVRTHNARDQRDAIAVVERLRRATSSDPVASVEPVSPHVPSLREPGCISLTGIKATGFHGVYAEEKIGGQMFLADVVMHLDLETRSDLLADTVDYSVVARDIAALIGGESVDLIETLAGRIADRCLAEASVQAVDVCVHKPDAPLGITVSDISVSLHRRRT